MSDVSVTGSGAGAGAPQTVKPGGFGGVDMAAAKAALEGRAAAKGAPVIPPTQPIVPTEKPGVATVKVEQKGGGISPVGVAPKAGGPETTSAFSFEELLNFVSKKPEAAPGPEKVLEEFEITATDTPEIKTIKENMNRKFTRSNQDFALLKQSLEQERQQYQQMNNGLMQQVAELRGMLAAFQQPLPNNTYPGAEVSPNNMDLPEGAVDPVLNARLTAMETQQRELQAFRDERQRDANVQRIKAHYEGLIKDDPLLQAAGEQAAGFIITAAIAGHTSIADSMNMYRDAVRSSVGDTPERVRHFIQNSPNREVILSEALRMAQEMYLGSKKDATQPVGSFAGAAVQAVQKPGAVRRTLDNVKDAATEFYANISQRRVRPGNIPA